MKRFKIILGVLFILSVGYAYYEEPEFLYEMTAIPNTLAGLILIVDGILESKGKKII